MTVGTLGAALSAFEHVANALPEERAALLEGSIAADRPFVLLALLAITILVAGGAAFSGNRRRLRDVGRGGAGAR